jgi:hypothetical protein
MLTMLGWGVAATALLNLLAIVALVVAYAWNDWLRPRLDLRRARQRAFERLLYHSHVDMLSEASSCDEWPEW